MNTAPGRKSPWLVGGTTTGGGSILNASPIPCSECPTDAGATCGYALRITRGGNDLFIKGICTSAGPDRPTEPFPISLHGGESALEPGGLLSRAGYHPRDIYLKINKFHSS